jgi:hypothetical protein
MFPSSNGHTVRKIIDANQPIITAQMRQRRNVTSTKFCYCTVAEDRILNEKILRYISCFSNNEQSGFTLKEQNASQRSRTHTEIKMVIANDVMIYNLKVLRCSKKKYLQPWYVNNVQGRSLENRR